MSLRTHEVWKMSCAVWLAYIVVVASPTFVHAMAALQDVPGSVEALGSQNRLVPGLASKGNLSIALAGGAATWMAYRMEDADAEAQFLGRGAIDGGSDVGNAYGDGRVLLAGTLGLWVAGRVGENPDLTGAAAEMAKALVLSTACVWALKVAVDRTRPDGGEHSFPSGHTAGAFSVAPVLSHRFGWRAAIPAYTLATLTAAGRIEDRRHYLSDVVFGATIGLIAGETVVHGGEESRLIDHIRIDERGAELELKF